MILLPALSEKMNKTHLSSCRLVVGKPCELITECSRVLQLSEYHYCGTPLHSVIDSQQQINKFRQIRKEAMVAVNLGKVAFSVENKDGAYVEIWAPMENDLML